VDREAAAIILQDELDARAQVHGANRDVADDPPAAGADRG
jgi:hypothetical protein